MRRRRCHAALLALALLAGFAPATRPGDALAAGPPRIVSNSVDGLTATSANLHAQINPEGSSTTYRFEYLTEAAYQANLGAGLEGFAGATFAPPSGVGLVGSGNSDVAVSQHLSGLAPLTTYRYRVQATSSAGFTAGPPHFFGTQAPTNVFTPLDGRGWEMVSPVDKGGGAIAAPEKLFGGGAFQAAADGASVTYSSASSFAGGSGAPGASQYISRRGSGGWATENITAPSVSGSYGDRPDGVPYRVFSTDLGASLLLNGERCRGEGSGCPVANPPLPGSGAPPGYQDYYRRDDGTGAFRSLLTAADLSHSRLSASEFSISLSGATSDLVHVVLSSCAALAAGAVEAPAAGGCAPEAQNLYMWSGGGLTLLNLAPGTNAAVPGATLAAPRGAIGADGSHVYWTDAAGDLYLYQAGRGKAVDESGEAQFQVASSDGSLAYFLKARHLYRYSAVAGTATDLTPGGGVDGVLGASDDGGVVYYQTTAGLFVWQGGAARKIVAGAAATAGDYPPATGSARVTADGSHLAFRSTAELTGYENTGFAEVFLYGPTPGGGLALVCASCNPTGERPEGGATIPGAPANGSTVAYKPRVLSADGRRIFFDSLDALSTQDTNHRLDVYEWEAAGDGSCERPPGCVQLVSGGRGGEASTFLDASASGSNVFFLTGESLVPTDPGSIDVYDYREGGGFPVPPTPIPCDGDACQVLPPAPEDPTPGTLVPNAGNPPLELPKERHRKHRKRKHHRRHKHHHHKGKKGKHGPKRGGRHHDKRGGRR